MVNSRNRIPTTAKYCFGLALLLSVCAICVAFGTDDNDDYATARREVLLRRIGHELLLQSGDSTSRVLPVQKISENDYQISFENDFAFHTDFLVNTTQRLLAKDPLAGDYVVNVINCSNADVAYGYSISKDKKEDIVACTGRNQPKSCYKINIKFKPAGTDSVDNKYLLGGLSFLAFTGFFLLRLGKPRKVLPESKKTDAFVLGALLFDAKNRKLEQNGQIIDLTATETRLLLIFALMPNQTIERSRLQKEIWEDEGVIVGRSLDMFISKLRKKLEMNPNIKIIVIRGKGYKLEILD